MEPSISNQQNDRDLDRGAANRDDEYTITISMVPRSIALCVLLVGFVCWIGGLALRQASPTQPDPVHTIASEIHGTTYYLTPLRYALPWIGLFMCLGSLVFLIGHFLYLCDVTGFGEGELNDKLRGKFFCKITLETVEPVRRKARRGKKCDESSSNSKKPPDRRHL